MSLTSDVNFNFMQNIINIFIVKKKIFSNIFIVNK
jgi:hypothetical protein